ncbi:hypothetical protein CFter6_1093 [Collimonas fungivorans]|uniref:Uncharacterized protein n=1 Tax=Collimonas fungivorans TaxID=158899 RepID=A0A127P8R6_9BURK|nr:hypothetical protein [Collimonas fungivorans]AMO93811.1 hypothetical protein CFter6_1093 [Collimonas fungivorans]
MMRFFNSFIIFLFWLIFFPIFIYIFLNGDYSKKYEHTILSPPEISEQTPTGELTTGIRFEQPLNWSWINTRQLGKSDTLCVDLLLANYNNRRNIGTFALTLKSENFSQQIKLNASLIRDNAYRRFCYGILSFKDIRNKPATLILEGIDSPSGKAVSAWMTSDITQGKLIRNGLVLNKSLIFSISAITESHNKYVGTIIVLTLLCILSISVLFWPKNLESH